MLLSAHSQILSLSMTKLLRNTSIPEAPCSNLNFLLKVAVALEKAAQSDEYFVKRKLYPNVDFYTGFIYRAMGFPTMFFPVLFAIPRVLPTSGGLFGEVPQGYFKASCPASIPDTYYCLHFLYGCSICGECPKT
ncbi:citrate synthase 1, peroxisomal-like [Rosa sericea]